MIRRTYTAAGGVVLDQAGRVLLITREVQRNGKLVREVRLPKGHVEAGESDAQAALREVCEETGYCDVAIVDDLGTMLSDFSRNGEWVSRTEHYYLMRLGGGERGEPHFDSPDAEEARFVPLWAAGLTEAQAALTFPSEQRFIGRALARQAT
jgi:ADP-ribose pyrophosphatase YjhB (NUDIX family)